MRPSRPLGTAPSAKQARQPEQAWAKLLGASSVAQARRRQPVRPPRPRLRPPVPPASPPKILEGASPAVAPQIPTARPRMPQGAHPGPANGSSPLQYLSEDEPKLGTDPRQTLLDNRLPDPGSIDRFQRGSGASFRSATAVAVRLGGAFLPPSLVATWAMLGSPSENIARLTPQGSPWLSRFREFPLRRTSSPSGRRRSARS
jgi:hypothetical protein